MKSWFVASALFLIDPLSGCPNTGYVGNTIVTDQQKVLSKLLDNIGSDPLPLEDVYFTIREDGAAKSSTLYRFNLTEGKMLGMHTKVKPSASQDCYAQGDLPEHPTKVWCVLNLVGLEAEYNGALSYGKPIVQNFNISARIVPHAYNNNPALVIVSLIEGYGCNSEKCPLAVEDTSVFLSAFELNATTTPKFVDFKGSSGAKFDKFQKNASLANLVRDDFDVKMYTHVLPKVRKAIMDAYKSELARRVTNLGNNLMKMA